MYCSVQSTSACKFMVVQELQALTGAAMVHTPKHQGAFARLLRALPLLQRSSGVHPGAPHSFLETLRNTVAPNAKEYKPHHLMVIVNTMAVLNVYNGAELLDAIRDALMLQAAETPGVVWCGTAVGLEKLMQIGRSNQRCADNLS